MLAFLVLATSAGLAVDVHYCQGHIKTFSVFGKAKGCSDLEQIAPFGVHQKENTCGDTMGKSTCCENEFQYFQPDQSQFAQTSVSVSVYPAIPVFVVTYTRDRESNHDVPAFSSYKPPPILKDIPVLMQVFLL